jgi:RNA polymerase sigma factor (sigma-70 family)
VTEQQAHTALFVARRVARALWRRAGDLRLATIDDLTGAGLLAVCERAERYDPEQSDWEGFCGMVAYQGATNYARHVRGIRSRPASDGSATRPTDIVASTEDDVAALFDAAEAPDRTDFAAEASDVLAATSRLPEPYADAVRGYYLTGLDDREIAEAAGVSRALVSLRRRSAVAHLRLRLHVEPDARRRQVERDGLGRSLQKALRGLESQLESEVSSPAPATA